jgi:hypothetical protein
MTHDHSSSHRTFPVPRCQSAEQPGLRERRSAPELKPRNGSDRLQRNHGTVTFRGEWQAAAGAHSTLSKTVDSRE